MINIFSFSDELLKRIKERKDIYSTSVTSGSAQSFEHYQNLVGRIQTIQECTNIIKDLLRSLENPNS